MVRDVRLIEVKTVILIASFSVDEREGPFPPGPVSTLRRETALAAWQPVASMGTTSIPDFNSSVDTNKFIKQSSKESWGPCGSHQLQSKAPHQRSPILQFKWRFSPQPLNRSTSSLRRIHPGHQSWLLESRHRVIIITALTFLEALRSGITESAPCYCLLLLGYRKQQIPLELLIVQ